MGIERDQQQDHRDGRPEADAHALADDVVGDQDGQQFESIEALVDDVDDVEGAQRLDDGDDDDHDVDGLHHREDHVEERLALVGAVDLGGLTQAGVNGLESGQVQDHHVAHVAPAGSHEHGPQVQVAVSQPVDEAVVRAGGAQQAVQEALVGRVDEVAPDEADDGQREHHGHVQGALVEARAADVLVQQDRQEHAQRRGEHGNQTSQMMLCWSAGQKKRVLGEEDLVVPEPDPVVRSSGSPMPFQVPNDQMIERMVGMMMKTVTTVVGMATIRNRVELVPSVQRAVAALPWGLAVRRQPPPRPLGRWRGLLRRRRIESPIMDR